MAENSETEGMSKEWNYHPELPLADPSIFNWPPRPGFLIRWFARNWLTLSERMMMILAVVLWLFAYPSLETTSIFAPGWIFQIWIINIALMLAIAGGLHWYFYMHSGQGKQLKFDHRDQAKGNRLWNFANQVHDNMFWSLTSGVAQLTFFQALTMWLMGNGYVPTITPGENPIWFVLGLVLLPIWSAFHFYWVHRLLHVPFFYKHFHILHHRYYECNYGNQEMPWDRWFGTFHNGSQEGTQATKDRRRKMYQA